MPGLLVANLWLDRRQPRYLIPKLMTAPQARYLDNSMTPDAQIARCARIARRQFGEVSRATHMPRYVGVSGLLGTWACVHDPMYPMIDRRHPMRPTVSTSAQVTRWLGVPCSLSASVPRLM